MHIVYDPKPNFILWVVVKIYGKSLSLKPLPSKDLNECAQDL